ncbi:P-loop containing nucleoside triphosphate hydrolase protein [Gamsiella multidivaricata]|uniref:P-loop containing nucleoside triphosphate hydrolase protein n=1 Tax=Gamsiella multidivaricata TaxID=101098 RepID=UPI002220042F|nr:P-loop containing nucleoside triphosphate hydrolase protein [Gamsiella multidivaricata]KAI7832823.1 P-loop containing nucleoside triphosphate hydrolase protein [Gamsiella multidivaricata]
MHVDAIQGKGIGKKGKKSKKKKDEAGEVSTDKKAVSYLALYRFATKKEYIYITIAIIGSIATGVGQPLVAVLMGRIITHLTAPVAVDKIIDDVVLFVIIGAAVFLCAYLQMCFWTLAAENQVKRIREKYLHAILRQDIGWHDTGKQAESLTTRLNSDTQLIYDGMADKVGLALSSFTTFVAGFVIGFTNGWRLSLVLLACVPLIGACAVMMSKITVQMTSKGQDSYSKAGSIAEQAFSSIRTIVAFGGQKRETAAYVEQLDLAYANGKKRSYVTGLGLGMFMFILFSTYGLAFWFGAHEVYKGNMESGQVLSVFMGMIIGAFALGNIGPNVSSFASAQGAAYNIFQTIDRIPVIDSSSPNGAKPENVLGHIVVRDVDFVYPSRPDVPILKKMSIEVKPGQTVALVGHSGSGKSTIVGLVERFYDPLSGSITLDGIEIKDWNVTYLRDTIGIVSQEPVLFNASIKQNIIYGMRKDQSEPTDKEIEAACRLSNAHDFIMKLPNKYDTLVGEKGALLSGGQKQRIAIARALIKNPRILLLDEATSALDTESERIVQAALDKASAGRSTIVIAHRLSTIMNADVIYVMDKGIVLESGSHESLLAQGGVYSELVAKQQLKTGGTDVDTIEDDVVPDISTSPHIAIADEPVVQYELDNHRKSGTFSTKLRRMSSIEKRKKKEHAAFIKAQKAPIMRVLKIMRPEWGLIFVGAILSGGAGAIFPMFAKFFGEILDVLQWDPAEHPTYLEEVNHDSLMFVVIGIANMIATGGSVMIFELAGERMARRMRTLSFQAIMSQEMGFFDREENTTGALASRLATDAYQMHELVSQIMKLAFQVLVTVGLSLGYAFSRSWRLTLVILAVIPLLAASQFFAMQTLTGFSTKTKKAYEQSGRVASEAISNVRTVVALAKEETFESRYYDITKAPHSIALRRAYFGSVGYAMSQGVMFWTYAVGFYAGYRFVEAEMMQWSDLFSTMFFIVFMAMGLGQMAAQLPRFVKGKESAINVFELLDKHTTIDAYKDGISPDSVNGYLGLEDVHFHYPTRPDQQIFKGVNVSVKPGQTVALVGPSGCGKSTIIALLERWYDTLEGKATIDTYDVKDLQLDNIRKHMALVGQEPVLFDISIGENIRYGIPDGQTVDQEQVVAAARAANIHDFVVSLPQGYDTRVGDKGSQLSGGQKQRIAIARALIRNPKILLLDEATSALDSESEKLVQEALDKARAGRTTVVIAHRLRTIQDADLILVVKDGAIVESGRHYELIGLGGLYAELCTRQNLDVSH